MNEYIALAKTIWTAQIKAKLGHILLVSGGLLLFTFLFGWMVFGWLLFPVKWTPDRFNTAPIESQIVYVHLFSEWLAYSNAPERANEFIAELDKFDDIACYLAEMSNDLPEKARYIKAAYVANGVGCLPQP